jgi:hypothetical protein
VPRFVMTPTEIVSHLFNIGIPTCNGASAIANFLKKKQSGLETNPLRQIVSELSVVYSALAPEVQLAPLL